MSIFQIETFTFLFLWFQILACANEGLQYLDERKDFWQQQKPVYARQHELGGAAFGLKQERKKRLSSVRNWDVKFEKVVKLESELEENIFID